MKLQISAAHGPGECECAAALALQRLSAEAAAHGIRVEIHDERRSRHGIQSAVITLSGDEVAAFAARWQGTIQSVDLAKPYPPQASAQKLVHRHLPAGRGCPCCAG